MATVFDLIQQQKPETGKVTAQPKTVFDLAAQAPPIQPEPEQPAVATTPMSDDTGNILEHPASASWESMKERARSGWEAMKQAYSESKQTEWKSLKDVGKDFLNAVRFLGGAWQVGTSWAAPVFSGASNVIRTHAAMGGGDPEVLAQIYSDPQKRAQMEQQLSRLGNIAGSERPTAGDEADVLADIGAETLPVPLSPIPVRTIAKMLGLGKEAEPVIKAVLKSESIQFPSAAGRSIDLRTMRSGQTMLPAQPGAKIRQAARSGDSQIQVVEGSITQPRAAIDFAKPGSGTVRQKAKLADVPVTIPEAVSFEPVLKPSPQTKPASIPTTKAAGAPPVSAPAAPSTPAIKAGGLTKEEARARLKKVVLARATGQTMGSLLDAETLNAAVDLGKIYADEGVDWFRHLLDDLAEVGQRVDADDIDNIVRRVNGLQGVGVAARASAGLSEIERRATAFSTNAKALANKFEVTNEKIQTALEQTGNVAETGTLQPKEIRIPWREGGQPTAEQTFGFRFSRADIEQSKLQLVALGEELRMLERSVDPASREILMAARKNFERAAKEFQVYRSAGGRALHAWNQGIPPDLIESLRELGVLVGGMKNIKERVPIATNILESFKRLNKLDPAEQRQLGRDLVDHFRLNLFSITSFTIDAASNVGAVVGEMAGSLGRDIAALTRGVHGMYDTRGWIHAIRYRARHPLTRIDERIESQFFTTAKSEILTGARSTPDSFLGKKFKGSKALAEVFGPGKGVFTYRENVGSTIYDLLTGAPLYMKGAIDTMAKRLGAMSIVYRDAMKAADDLALTGANRAAFIDNFVARAPDSTIEKAIQTANKASFSQPLGPIAESVANSTAIKLLADSFPRWSIQFTRWAGEMLGYNKPLIRKMIAGEANMEEVFGYLAKAATGWSGLMLLNQYYDRVDPSTMEYVRPDGNRIRLSNRDPINTGLWFLGILRGDPRMAYEALKFSSVVGAKWISQDGGLLTTTIKQFLQATKNPQNDPRAFMKELNTVINKAIPGQAVLGFIKTIADPTLREGIGANLPGVSFTKSPVIDNTTGEPYRPRQILPYTESLGFPIETPAITGTPIPGATRILSPARKVLEAVGMTPYRPLRTPIAGFPPGNVPPELRREWEIELGKARNELLGPLADDAIRIMEGTDVKAKRRFEEKVKRLDDRAGKIATLLIRRRYPNARKPEEKIPWRRTLKPPIYRKGE